MPCSTSISCARPIPGTPDWRRFQVRCKSAIIARARAALDSGDAGKADALVKSASGLGSSAELDALRDAVAQQKLKQSAAASATVPASSLAVQSNH